MKRYVLTAAVVVSVLGLVSNAQAGQKKHNKNSQPISSESFQQFSPNLGLDLPPGGGLVQKLLPNSNLGNLVSRFKKKKHQDQENPIPIDPGRGDGRVPVEPTTPPARPGYVWVGDHWERERAPKVVTPTKPGYVWVGDHWEREKAPLTPTMIVDPIPGTGSVVVRDHRTGDAPVVRDHRTNQPLVRDHRDGAGLGGTAVTGGSMGVFGGGNLTGIPFPIGPSIVVRDHRASEPIVRDHRTSEPLVRDHR